MKTNILILASSIFLSGMAVADTVNITTIVSFNEPAHVTSSTASYGFTPNAPIAFMVAGKFCKWVSSYSDYGAGGGYGCNYSITINPDGSLSDAKSNGGGCTASGKAMLQACQ